MKAMVFSGVLVAALVGAALPATAVEPQSTVIDGDIIRTNTVWNASANPYIITRAVQIAPGATLTIGPGVEIQGQGTEYLFRVGGSLKAAGSPGAVIDIDGGRAASVLSIPTTAVDPSVELSYTRIHNGKAIMPPAAGKYTTLRITDSVVENMPEYNYLWYVEPGSIIARNTFSSSGGFSVGIDSRTSSSVALTIQSNRFRTASTTGYWIENWAAYGEPLRVVGNAFEAPGEPSVALRKGYSSTAVNASGNYWGTTDRDVINAMVIDGLDDIEYAGIIPIDPILTAPPANLPPAPPQPPTDVTGEALDGGDVSVSWSPPAGLGTSTGIRYAVSTSPGNASCEVTDAFSCTVSRLTIGNTYTFSVTATNSAGTSQTSIPSAPVLVTSTQGKAASRVSNGRISASIEGRWLEPSGCGSYLVRYSGMSASDVGSIQLVDAATGESIDSELFLAPKLSSGVFSYQLCGFEVEGVRQFRLVLDFDGQEVQGGVFSWQTRSPAIGQPKALPGRVSVGNVSISTTGTWTLPSDGCSNLLFTYSGITDDDIGSVKLIDAATRGIVASQTFLGRVGNGLGNFQVCESDVNAEQSLLWQADFFGYSVTEGEIFSWQERAPRPASPTELPAAVSLGPITVSTTGDWSYPSSCRNFTFDYIGWDSDYIGSVTLIEATTRNVIASEIFISEPSSGSGELFVCGFEVTPTSRLLLQIDASGLGTAESSVFTWEGSTASIIITGSRTTVKGKPGIRVTGSVSGLPAGTKLAPKVKFGKKKFRTFKATISVKSNGEFTWQRRTNARTTVIIQTADGSVVSNRVRINPRG